MRTKLLALLSLGAAGLAPAVKAQEIPLTRIDIDVAQEKAEVAPTMYGIFFEDINRSADGGIYAELIFNRGFEEANLPSGCTYNPNDKRVYAPRKSVYSSPEHLRSWSIPWNIEVHIQVGRSNVRPTANIRFASTTPTIWASRIRRLCT